MLKSHIDLNQCQSPIQCNVMAVGGGSGGDGEAGEGVVPRDSSCGGSDLVSEQAGLG